jgi:hypothetical protein
VGHASRSSSLLGVEASLATVSQSDLKTGRGATTGGARGHRGGCVRGKLKTNESM